MEHPRLFIFFVLLVLNALCYAAEPPAPDNEKLQAFNASYAEFEDLLKTERIEQALQKCREAFELAREIFGESHKTTAELSYNYGLLLNKVGYYPLAKDILTEAIAIHEKVYGTEAFELIPVLEQFGETLAFLNHKDGGDSAAQSSALHRALNIHKKHNPDDRIGYADLNTRVASQLVKTRPDDTEVPRMLDESLAIYEEEYGSNAIQLVPVLMALGDANAKPFNPSKQKSFYNKALEITKDNFPDDPVRYADISLESGQHILWFSKSVDAKSYLIKAHSGYEKALGKDNHKTALSALALGEYYFATQDHKNSEQYTLSALNTLSSNPNYRNYTLRAHGLLVVIYERGYKPDLATEHLLAIGKIAPWTPDQDVQPAFRVNPMFPSDAFWDVKGGWTIIDFTIDQTGRVQDAVVESHEGHLAYKKAALKAVKKFRYAPRFVDGKPVSTPHIKIKMIFEKQ